MDAVAPPALLRGYQTLVLKNKRTKLYRHAFIGRAGHCVMNVSEIAALVDMLIGRIETGRWPRVWSPEVLNTLAASFRVDDPAFIDYRLPVRLNRTLQ
jgi:hypothetical protein